MAQVVYNKHTKDTFQAAISRGNPNLVTPVELDFSLPRNIALAQQCQVLLNWETSYKTLSRQAPSACIIAVPRIAGQMLRILCKRHSLWVAPARCCKVLVDNTCSFACCINDCSPFSLSYAASCKYCKSDTADLIIENLQPELVLFTTIPHCQADCALHVCRSAGRLGSGSRSTASSGGMEEYRPVVNTLPEVTQLLLGQERHCQGLLDVLQPDQSQGPQVVSLCGAPGAGLLLPTLLCFI